MATQTSPGASPIAPSLFALSIFYGGMVCIAGVLGNKQVALGPLAVEAGIFAFLLLVVTSSAVAELHGRSTANRLVLIGFVPLIASLVLSIVVLALPASPQMDPARLSAFDCERAQPGRRHADFHHYRFLRRVPDRRVAAWPDAGEGRPFGSAGPAAGIRVRGLRKTAGPSVNRRRVVVFLQRFPESFAPRFRL